MLGFTFMMGLLLGPLLQFALRFSNGGQLIMTAGAATALVFIVMAGIASTTKRDLSALGSFLTVGAIVLMVAVVANIFLQMPGVQLAIAAAFALFSSLMILWQVKLLSMAANPAMSRPHSQSTSASTIYSPACYSCYWH
jgi:FtsH-binding integral membrane protein